MNTHTFAEGVKVEFFCLTLEGEARLWYEFPRSIALVCNGLQAQYNIHA